MENLNDFDFKECFFPTYPGSIGGNRFKKNFSLEGLLKKSKS